LEPLSGLPGSEFFEISKDQNPPILVGEFDKSVANRLNFLQTNESLVR